MSDGPASDRSPGGSRGADRVQDGERDQDGDWDDVGERGTPLRDGTIHERRPPSVDGRDPWHDPDGGDEGELHPVLDVVADASIYLVVGSLLLAVLGLAALAVGFRPYGNVMVAGAGIAAMGSMTLAALVGTFSGMLSPFD